MQTNSPFNFARSAITLATAMMVCVGCATAASNPVIDGSSANVPHTTAGNAATGAPSNPASGTHAQLPTGVAATVNSVPILQSQIDQVVVQAKVTDTPSARANIKNGLIARELFRQAAEQKHYDTRPEVLQAMQDAKVTAESQLFLRESIHPAEVTDAQVKARYDEIVFGLGKMEYKPRMIEVADDATASAVLVKVLAGDSFDALAKQYSIAANKAAGGELPWVSFKLPLVEGKTQGLPLAMAQAIVQLPIGGSTPAPIVINGARFIVKVDQARPSQVPTFDQAKTQIRSALEQVELQKATAGVTVELIKNAQIQQ